MEMLSFGFLEQWMLGYALLTLITGYFFYYIFHVVHVPKLVRPPGKWGTFLQENMPVLRRKYWPTPWCHEGRLQTILGSFIRSMLFSKDIKYERDVLVMPDGGEISLDWLYPEKDFSFLCLFLPGLTGDSQTDYIKPLVLIAHQQGAAAVVMNNRGKGGLRLKTSRTYCAANCDDLREAMKFIVKKHPHVNIMGAGTSLGSMILGHYMRTEEDVTNMTCGFMVSPLYQPNRGMTNLERGFLNVQLGKQLTYALHDTVREFHDLLSDSLDLDHVYKSRTLREFDARFTAPNFGYPSMEAYYEASCLHERMHHMKIPVLCLSAEDDPFQLGEVIPVKAIEEECSRVAMLLTSRGGHLGFLEGIIPKVGSQYIDVVFKEYLQAVMKNVELLKTMRST